MQESPSRADYTTTTPIHFSIDGALHGEENMQRDSELLVRAEAGVASARVYGWEGAWISLGKQQIAGRDLSNPNLVPWVMRPTGGKAVLHGHDITVGMAFPLAALPSGLPPELLSRSVTAVYRLVIAPLVRALNRAGAQVALGEDTAFCNKGARTVDCFANLSPNDVVDTATGRKACGCALRLTSTAVLVQASIPNGPPLVDPRRVFPDAQPSQSIVEIDKHQFAGFLRSELDALLATSSEQS